jgi:hypothetical protein
MTQMSQIKAEEARSIVGEAAVSCIDPLSSAPSASSAERSACALPLVIIGGQTVQERCDEYG